MTTQLSSYVDRVERQLNSEPVPWVATGVLTATMTLWVALLAGWVPMPVPSDLPMSAPGAMEGAAVASGAVGAYLVMWGVMMAAMMYPAMLPFARRYADTLQGDRAEVTTAMVTFFLTYALVWTATGAVPLAVDVLVDVDGLVTAAPALVYGLTLLFVGGYQLSAFKDAALQDCCGRVTASDPDPRKAVELGLRNGRLCVLATWHLFALLVLVGSMNVVWMTGLTAIVVAERLPRWGGEIARAVGVMAVLAGVVVLLPLPFPFP